MELTYPINFVGYKDTDSNADGEVVTRDGEYLGKWMFTRDETYEAGAFHFIVDGETEPLFSKDAGSLGSELSVGMAMSAIFRNIREWHEHEDAD